MQTVSALITAIRIGRCDLAYRIAFAALGIVRVRAFQHTANAGTRMRFACTRLRLRLFGVK